MGDLIKLRVREIVVDSRHREDEAAGTSDDGEVIKTDRCVSKRCEMRWKMVLSKKANSPLQEQRTPARAIVGKQRRGLRQPVSFEKGVKIARKSNQILVPGARRKSAVPRIVATMRRKEEESARSSDNSMTKGCDRLVLAKLFV